MSAPGRCSSRHSASTPPPLPNGGRWVCEDADAGRHDLDAGAFRSAGRAWLACRQDGDNPGSYGIGPGWGWPELRGSLLSDAAALVKDERFTFDWWELAEPPSEPDAAEDAWLDRLAELTLEDERMPQLCEQIKANPAFTRDRVRTPAPPG
jgi:hypothetical protein